MGFSPFYACQICQEGARRLTLGAELADESRLRLTVSDEGEGIAPENLSRIFNHGFTTRSRSRGHGFGLHSCALAAKEMGGVLTASSLGVGKGATFVLELPASKVSNRAVIQQGVPEGSMP